MDASVRKRPQASASVRGASDLCQTCVGLASDLPETKIVAKRRTVVTFYVSYYKSVNSHWDRGGRGRETQNCHHFWTRLASSRLKSVNSHRDRGGPWSRNAELSSLFTFRITKVSTVTGIGGVVVAKRRTVITFGLVSGLRVSKVSTVTGIAGGVVAKRRTVVTFGLASGERRGERREEKREMRGEKRGERREERREERDERREKRGEKRDEKREERRERREKTGERREERREEEKERGEKREEEEEEKGMTPDLSLLSGFARGVLLSLHVRDTCLHSGSWLLSGVSAFGFVAPIWLSFINGGGEGGITYYCLVILLLAV